MERSGVCGFCEPSPDDEMPDDSTSLKTNIRCRQIDVEVKIFHINPISRQVRASANLSFVRVKYRNRLIINDNSIFLCRWKIADSKIESEKINVKNVGS